MNASLMLAIEPLRDSYSDLHSRLMLIHDQPLWSDEVKAEKMRVALALALSQEQPNTPKAIAVYELVKILLTAYPKNNGVACPITLDSLNFDKPEENFYSSISGYVYNKVALKGWFSARPNQTLDPMNREPISQHEMSLLIPKTRYSMAYNHITNNCEMYFLLYILCYTAYYFFDQGKLRPLIAVLIAGTDISLHPLGLQQNSDIEYRRRRVFYLGTLFFAVDLITGNNDLGDLGIFFAVSAVLYALVEYPVFQSPATMRSLLFRGLERQNESISAMPAPGTGRENSILRA